MIQHQIQHQLLKQVPTALLCMSLSSRHWSENPAHQKHQVSLLSHIPDVLDVLPKQSSKALATGAMRVATAMYQFELRTLIHPQCDMSVCDQATNKTKPSHWFLSDYPQLKFQTLMEHLPQLFSTCWKCITTSFIPFKITCGSGPLLRMARLLVPLWHSCRGWY